jgi:hypothetical protein
MFSRYIGTPKENEVKNFLLTSYIYVTGKDENSGIVSIS